MGKRHRASEIALMILYELEFQAGALPPLLESFWRERAVLPEIRDFAESLVRGTVEHLAVIDETIAKNAAHWSLARIAPVERNILRLATYELLRRYDIPERVVINEAIELAKMYGSEESGAFVNGILDHIRLRLKLPERSPA